MSAMPDPDDYEEMAEGERARREWMVAADMSAEQARRFVANTFAANRHLWEVLYGLTMTVRHSPGPLDREVLAEQLEKIEAFVESLTIPDVPPLSG